MLTLVERLLTVSAVVMTPVKIDMIINPVRTHIIANSRPGTPTGAMSPYLWLEENVRASQK